MNPDWFALWWTESLSCSRWSFVVFIVVFISLMRLKVLLTLNIFMGVRLQVGWQLGRQSESYRHKFKYLGFCKQMWASTLQTCTIVGSFQDSWFDSLV